MARLESSMSWWDSFESLVHTRLRWRGSKVTGLHTVLVRIKCWWGLEPRLLLWCIVLLSSIVVERRLETTLESLSESVVDSSVCLSLLNWLLRHSEIRGSSSVALLSHDVSLLEHA